MSPRRVNSQAVNINSVEWNDITFHFSSCHWRTLACPLRNRFRSEECPYSASLARIPGKPQGCVFDHALNSGKEEFDLDIWKLRIGVEKWK